MSYILVEQIEDALARRGCATSLVEVDVFNLQSSDRIWSANALQEIIHAIEDRIYNLKGNGEPWSGCDTPVAIFLSPSVAYVASAVASLTLKMPFLPIDPRWPQHTIEDVLRRETPRVLIWAEEGTVGGHGYPGSLPQGCASLEIDAEVSQGLPKEGNSVLECRSSRIRAPSSISENVAYILPTSGSTGIPLSVCGTPQGIINRCEWMAEAFPFQEGDCVAFSTAPVFVDSIWEFFGPLIAGVPIVTLPFSISNNPEALVQVLKQHRVTHFTAVPSVWKAIVLHMKLKKQSRNSYRGEIPETLCTLRQVVSSGEPLSWDLLHDMRDILPKSCRILNLYGSTEVSADATCIDTSKEESAPGTPYVPVGRPIRNTFVVIVPLDKGHTTDDDANDEISNTSDSARVAALPGEQGEILIGGAGVAHSYSRNEEATRQRFVMLSKSFVQQHAVSSPELNSRAQWDTYTQDAQNESVRLFATGDIGKWDDSGNLVILGRKDLQIKVRGTRVDLLHVEEVLAAGPHVHAAAAKGWETPTGERVVVGYIVLASGSGSARANGSIVDSALVRWSESVMVWCRERLPTAAVPAAIIQLPELPRTAAGKINRSALPNPGQYTRELNHTPAKRPRTSSFANDKAFSEVHVHAVFAAALGHASFEPTTNLFLAGGTSITAADISNALGLHNPAVVMEHPTVRKLSAFIRQPPHITQRERNVPQRPTINARAWTETFHSVPPVMSVLTTVWRAKMMECVDASPICTSSRVFVSSHAGDVSCFDALTGQRIWQTLLQQGHADAGMVLCGNSNQTIPYIECECDYRYLAVAMTSGEIYFLDAADGCLKGSADAKGALRSPPTVDPWAGHVWVAGHSRHITVFDPCGNLILRYPLSAPASASITFSSSLGGDVFESRQVYVSCLDGSLLAFDIEFELDRGFEGGGEHARINLRPAWQYSLESPIFAAPILVNDDAVVVAVSVTGCIAAISRSGNCVWKSSIGEQEEGVYLSPVPLMHTKNKKETMLVATRSGRVYSVDCAHGEVAAIPLVLPAEASAMLSFSQRSAQSDCIIIALTAEGHIVVFDGSSLEVQDVVQLPAAAFALAPGPTAASVVIGCRDEFMYHFSLPSVTL